MAFTASGPSDGSGGNRSSRTLILVIGCLILIALAAAMLMHSGPAPNRTTVPGSGAKTQQR